MNKIHVRNSVILLLLLLYSIVSNGQTKETSYKRILSNIRLKQSEFRNSYCAHEADKDSIIQVARNYLLNCINDSIFPFWHGTKWDFNGTARIPGKGYIACGYFVTNTLTDLGFKIPRIKWAQSASEVFIKELAPNNYRKFSSKPLSFIEDYLFEMGDGLYVVGLDCHVGYVFVKNNTLKFIHSNYYKPQIGVMSEDINTRNPLRDSNYRVIGKLFDDEMIIKWINNIPYE